MSIDKNILEEFKKITNFDLQKFYADFVSFMQNKYNILVDFYSGNIEKFDKTVLDQLHLLVQQNNLIYDKIHDHKHQMNNYKWWDLLEQIDEINLQLNTVKNISKWLRSSVVSSTYSQSIQVQYIMGQKQTLENIARDVVSDRDWENSWADIAIDNKLREEDYTSKGGVLLKIYLKNTISRFNVESIVDNIYDERVLGKDIAKKFTFEDNDLKSLSYPDSFAQAVDILSTLRKGDNPEFPEHGINKSFTAGSNINMMAYPTIFRQYATTFSNDDSMKAFSIVDIKRQTDGIYLYFNIQSRLDEVQKEFSMKI